MSDQNLPPLDPEIAALLDAERPILPAPAAARARVLAGLDAAIGGGPSGNDGGAPPPPPPPPPSPPAPPVPSWWAGPAARALVIGATFGAGGAAGAGAVLALRPAPAPIVVYQDRPVSAPQASSAAPIADVPAAPATSAAPPPPTPAEPRSAAPAPPRPPPAAVLAEERALLDVARVALGRGSGEDALGALARHQRRFPQGALAEEREALLVQALVLAKKDEGARDRAEAFRKKYPGSILAPAVDAALGTNSSQDGGADPKRR